MSQELLQDNLRVFIVPVEILEVEGLSIYEKMAYIVIRSHANVREASAFPSYSTIAREGSMSRRKAIDAVASLVERGLLRKEIRLDVSKNRKIRNTSNKYYIERPATAAQNTSSSAQYAPPLVHDMHQGGAPHAPENNHLKKSFRNMFDCMNASAKTAAASESSPISKSDEIYEALNKHIPTYCFVNGLPLGPAYINEIYLMLSNQFSNQLSTEIVQIAAELYFDRACEMVSGSIQMRLDIENPTGFFQNCYKDAIKQYKLTRYRNNAASDVSNSREYTVSKQENHASRRMTKR